MIIALSLTISLFYLKGLIRDPEPHLDLPLGPQIRDARIQIRHPPRHRPGVQKGAPNRPLRPRGAGDPRAQGQGNVEGGRGKEYV